MSENSEKMNDTKRRIIEIARELFSKKGFENVTINEICKEVAISKHTFYYYFDSKEEILHPFYKVKDEWTAQMTSEIMKMDSPLEQLWHVMSCKLNKVNDIGPEIAKQMFVTFIQKDHSAFKEHMFQHPFHEMELTLLTKAQEVGEIQNMSEPSCLLHVIHLQSATQFQYWAMVNGERDLRNTLRCSFETTLDVKAELRKGDYEKW